MEYHEIWKRIENFPNYQISNLGNIKNTKTGRIIKQQNNGTGYKVVSLRINGKLKRSYVHRLVAISFCKKENGKNHVDHINCIRDDNRSDNLRWCTPKENCNFPQTRINASKSLKIAMNREDVKRRHAKSMENVYNDPNVKKKMSTASIINHKNGLYDHLLKKVLMIDIYGKIKKIYPSVSSVLSDGFDPSFVSKVCRNKKQMAYGYIWRFA